MDVQLTSNTAISDHNAAADNLAPTITRDTASAPDAAPATAPHRALATASDQPADTRTEATPSASAGAAPADGGRTADRNDDTIDADQSTALPTYEAYAHAPISAATVESYARAFLTYLHVRNGLIREVSHR